MITLPENYLIYETSYGSEVPINQVFVHLFKQLPSITKLNKKFKIEVNEFFEKNGFELECEVKTFSKRTEKKNTEYFFVNKEKELVIFSKTYTYDENDEYCELLFHYTTKNGKFEEQFNMEEILKLQLPNKKRGIGLIKSEMGHLDIEEFELNIPDMDIELNYGEDFLKVHETIVKRLNKTNDKGIILFHGDPGTGKTSYIKYLTRLIEEKEILFIPPSMAESLSEPSIIPFLMEHKNSILIIEDAEKVISDREHNGSSAGVSNILNLTDGILGDCLNIQIVATFNMKREKIDSALLRKGRLIAEHKFEPLSVDNANKLLKNLGKDNEVTKPMPLSDIYNIDEEFFRVENKQTSIGFNNNKK
jgi:energy-coupling factor transporter ATP-binding protein EcfA2